MRTAAVISTPSWRSLCALFAYLLLGGCSGMVPRASHSPPQARVPGATIYVARRGWHIDVGFAASELAPPIASLRAAFPGQRFLSFGFGDRHYLVARNKNFPALLVAVWPGPGLVLATGLSASPEEAFGATQVIRISVSQEAALAAQAYIWESLLSNQGVALPLANGPYEGSRYYTATQRYSGFHTCNTWAAEVLHAAGLPVHSAGVLFAGQLWAQLEQLPHGTAEEAPAQLSVPFALSPANVVRR
jgi:hypothetical protein